MRQIVLLVFSLVFSLAEAQESTLKLKLIKETPVNYDRFLGFDQFGFVYYINNNVLFKEHDDKKTLFQYQEFALGNISAVDLTNPLKITLYYNQSNLSIILDNRLNELFRINFNQVKSTLITAMVSTSRQDQLWVFDLNSQVLHQFDYRNSRIVNSSLPLKAPFNHFASGYNYFFYSNDNFVYGFNVYGNEILRKKHNASIHKLEFIYPNLLIVQDDTLKIYNVETKKKEVFDLSNIPYQDVFLNDENFYIYDGKTLKTYQVSD
ncbi:hypothetical protein [Psychroflexus sp. ALD_RP9]|uniref:hypothetical protein n=1 Tax=Psychroflexus sp. ALD_RP9 TaxID=2777186 RepID=UPI001A8E7862|nr:hypothetical protein [Psychroflexus sp. ALD_RP9]QSS96766.1 hypothetical protein IMZ30_09980 [Psychroflexus sp. ALD_RP9]